MRLSRSDFDQCRLSERFVVQLDIVSGRNFLIIGYGVTDGGQDPGEELPEILKVWIHIRYHEISFQTGR